MENKKEKEPKDKSKLNVLSWVCFVTAFLVVAIFRTSIWMIKATFECIYFVMGLLLGRMKSVSLSPSNDETNLEIANVRPIGPAVASASDHSLPSASPIMWKQFGVTLEDELFSEFDGELIADAVMGTFRLGLTQKDGKQVIRRFVDLPRSKHDHEKWRRCPAIMERVYLSDYTELIASARSRDFSADDAYALTILEVKRVWDGFKKRNWVTQEVASSPVQVTPMLSQQVPVALNDSYSAQILADDEESVSGTPSSYTGEVLSAQRIQVRPVGKKPYQIFQVVLQTDKGKEELNGKDLETAFSEKKFAIGNRVCFAKTKVSWDVGTGDSVKHRYKNVFSINVLK